MTNWPGRPGPDGGPHDQPGNPAPQGQNWPGPQAPGNYRQQWGTPPSAPPQAPGTPNAHQQPWTQPPPQGPSAQPWNQQPDPGGPPAGWGQPAQPGFGAPAPRKSRKPLLIAVLLVVGIAAYAGFRVVSGEGIAGIGATKELSAKDTVQQYLEALAAGDAQKALSFGAALPANSDLLTNDILAKQNAKLPLTNIRVLDEDTTGATIGMSNVHVAVNFGTVVDDVELPLKKDGNGVWKLENAAIKIDPPPGADSIKALKSVTVFGKNFDQGSLYLFPGYMEVSSPNKNLKVSAEPILLKGLAAYSSSYLDPKVELSDSGRAAVEQELADAFANCERSRQLDPSGCPTKVSSYDAADAIDGTVNWGKADLSGVDIGELSQYDMTVSLSGKATMSLSFQTKDGGTNQGMVSSYVSAEADMTSTPPSLTWR